MKYLRYKGEFLSISGVRWRVELWQESTQEFESIGALEFDADSPLTLEWVNKSKEEVICGSAATLKVISPGDRTYEDLYSIEVGNIRMDVYRNNALYWSGCLDTEFYEEPYEQARGYTVTLTFSDFGVMGRLQFNLTGIMSMEALLTHCVAGCGVIYGGIDDSLISTYLPSGLKMSLQDLNVRCDNFYDEDGEAKTLQEVIEGVFQPLALRLVQKAGKIYVYDINGLYNEGTIQRVEWNGASQTMGVDKVYNNVKITWSPYAQSGNLLPESCWPKEAETPSNVYALNTLSGGSRQGLTYFSYHYENKDLTKWLDAQDCGFTIWLSSTGNNAEIKDTNARFFKIVPQYDGSECEGIAAVWTAVMGEKYTYPGGWDARFARGECGIGHGNLCKTPTTIGDAIFSSMPVYIPSVSDAGSLSLRISLHMLLDPRFNPFESAENNELVKYKDWHDSWKAYGNYVYVPVMIKFQPEGSDAVYVWDNREIVLQNVKSPVRTLNGTYGQWVRLTDGSTPNAWGWLAYYDAQDKANACGVLGWQTNRPATNPHKEDNLSILTNSEVGQFIPFPNYGQAGGKVWVEVYAGCWRISDGGATLGNTEANKGSLWGKISWVLFKMPEIEIVNSAQFDKTIDTDDVEYSAVINPAAKEEMEIDTICGSSKTGVPTARGAYFNASTGGQITQLTRGGRTSQIEDLFIGTMFSQYDQRRTTLSGEAVILTDPVAAYTEDNQEGKKFMAVEDVQDVRLDTSDAEFVEIRPDEYESDF